MRSSFKYILPLLFAALSCEVEFDVDSTGGDPKMYVECYAGLADTTYLKLYRVSPVGGAKAEGYDFTLRDISFTAGGTPVALTKMDKTLYWTTETIPSGAAMEFSLETAEAGSVSASSSMPGKPSFTVTTKVIPSQFYSVSQFFVDFGGELTPEDYFGIVIEVKSRAVMSATSSQTITYEEITQQVPFSLDPPEGSNLLAGQSVRSAKIDVAQQDTTYSMALFNGEDYPDGVVVASLMTFDFSQFGEFDIPDEDEDDETDDEGDDPVYDSEEITYSYRITVFKLSAETYNYLNAIYYRQNNLLSMLGLSAPNYAYTNIDGGYGIFGGISRTSGDWLSLL